MKHRLTVFIRIIFSGIFLILFLFSERAISQSCNNWLSLPSYQSYVSIGDLDVTGDKITVEATFKRTTPYTGGQIWAGDLVSKHNTPSDVNYLLRPNNAEITTTNGYFRTPDICEIELNKTYHAAMVYDGTTLKFYRNGFLMSSVLVTGNMFQNNFRTRIGLYDAIAHNTNLIGYINEVRIWNVARSQGQILANMNSSLPNPTTQAGLLAYYTFDNLVNKQGNPAWNGTIGGNAVMGQTNPNCSLSSFTCTLTEVSPNFIIPDTVCVNTPVNISNISMNATSYYWNFCLADLNNAPIGTDIGNPGNLLSQPVFMDYVSYNGNYYGFLINHFPGKLVRLDFGNSLLNTPTAFDLGNFGGIIPPGYGAEGIQIVQNEGKWYAIIVGGYTPSGSTPRVLKIDFGPSLLNLAPVATDWGNIGNMYQPIDLHVFQENNNWYGFTINAENNTITRFDFTNSFDNIPSAVNLGSFGMLDYPTGIYAINDNGFWRVFVTNHGSNSRLVRLDFGNSLLNNPTAVNLGAMSTENGLRDLTIIKNCSQIAGFAVNAVTNSLYRLNFATLTSVPTVTDLGNTGNLSTPHSVSKIFRVNDDLYSFITNVGNNTITRLRFAGCTNSNPATSPLQNPPPVIYNTPGTYNINLTIDDGLPTRSSECKQVVVLPELEHKPIQNIFICDGRSIKIGSSAKIGSYQWNNGATADSIVVNTAGIFWVETSRFGCINRDSFRVTFSSPLTVNLGPDRIVCLPDNISLDAGNAGSSFLWNDGSTNQTFSVSSPGKYWVRVTKNGCVGSDTILLTAYDLTAFDFSYKQNVCDPLSIQFNGIGASLANSYWDFGDGATLTGNVSPEHRFASLGNYVIKYTAGNGICSDTLEKTISITISADNLIHTSDTTICYGTAKQLRTLPSLSFCWFPTTYLDDPSSPIPTTTATQDIIYYFTAEVTGNNLISNGNFSSGNTGFTSQYEFTGINVTEGQYFVGKSPPAWNGTLNICGDHTSGNGNMMMVNGAPTPNVNVWRQTVTVTPNTNYAFSTWIQALWPPNPAQLQFSLNGKDVGQVITANLPVCNWTQFYTTWNSGANTTAVISIVNKNTLAQGNDFALDDISFAPVFIKRDSVIIKIDKPSVIANADTTICIGAPAQMNATGAVQYAWNPAGSLNDPGIHNPVASPANSTQYIVTGTNEHGCPATDTVNVNVFTRPFIAITNDTTICKNSQAQLSVSGGNSYSWSPGVSLNSHLISNPIASPAVSTKYYVVIRDDRSCEYLDSVKVAIKPDPVFSVNSPAQICRDGSLQLNASGGDIYLWHPSTGLSNTGVPDPLASPFSTTDYSVTITESTCNLTATLTTSIAVIPSPIVNAIKSGDIDCSNDRSQLNASGADQYRWSPSATLTNASVSNPLAMPVTTTEYIVEGTDGSGCKGYDTITVKVDNANKGDYLMPSAFTPNNDGLNDCFGIRYWGIIQELEFSIFNRWGERIFFTKNASQCWDGFYKGVKQNVGVYVYMITAKTTCENKVFRKGTFVLVK